MCDICLACLQTLANKKILLPSNGTEDGQDGSSGSGHSHLQHAQFGAFGPRTSRGLAVKNKLAVVTRTPQDLAVVVKVDTPDGCAVAVELGNFPDGVHDLSGLTGRLPLSTHAVGLGKAGAQAGLMMMMMMMGKVFLGRRA